MEKQTPPFLPAAVEKILLQLGRNIHTARLRRKMRLVDLAERVGVSRYTMCTPYRADKYIAHGRFLLPKDETEKIMEKMFESVKKNWYTCLRRAGASEKDCDIVASAFVYNGFFLYRLINHLK